MELMQASHEWATRPYDERYLDLPSMHAEQVNRREHSRGITVPSRSLTCECVADSNHKGLVVTGPNGHAYAPTNWAFGQLATRAGAPAGYLRTLPSEMAADCINYGLKVARDIEDVGVLLYKNGGAPKLQAATGPAYGRIWNADITKGLMDRFGDGVTGQFRIPAEFGRRAPITKENTTLYAGDRDMFVFLADEDRRIEIPNRRRGRSGSLARGFFVWNSEVGSSIFGISTFLMDYMCGNHIVWGVEEFKELKIRHTSGAPDRFFREIAPALQTYANSSAVGVQQAIEDARSHKIAEDLDAFLKARNFTASTIGSMKLAHKLEEGRPIETRWDVVVAATAVARGIEWQDERVALERKAGLLLN